MTAQQQRFCPICDRSFEDGEAVLRCEGCGVMHHPACWVRNDGCVTSGDHSKTPIAQAYSSVRAPSGPVRSSTPPAHAAGPGSIPAPTRPRFAGQRYNREGEVPRPVLRRPQDQPEPMIGDGDDFEEGIVINHADGGAERSGDEPPAGRPKAPRRYEPQGDETPRKPLPKVYGRHRILDYWYVPVAVGLAVIVALGIIFAVDRLTGSDNQPASGGTPGAGAANETPAASPAAETPAATPPPIGTFSVGQTVVVTGSGECLNVRPSPGLDASNAPVACLPDGSELRIKGGPQPSGGLTWWNVESEQGNGWAAEDYLTAKP